MPAPHVTPLAEADLDEAREVLRAACAFDRAAEVAREKLLEPAPAGPATAWGVRDGEALVGVAAATGRWLRVLAVAPGARGRGVGGALLAAVEAWARAAGTEALRTLDLPGNYLAPGIDARNAEAIGWLERRGWARHTDNENLLVAVHGNPKVSAARADALADAARRAGYEVRRAGPGDTDALVAAVAAQFGGAWPFEVARALAGGAVHVAVHGGLYAAFAACDGNNQGLGWFGPAGTWPEHRGRGLGEALLVACLIDVAAAHDVCEVAWIGPRMFYDRCAGVAGDRRFVVLRKELR